VYQTARWGLWDLVVLPTAMLPFEDASLNSRVPKMLLHRLFGSAAYALYVDAKLRFKPHSLVKLWTFVSEQLAAQAATGGNSPFRAAPSNPAPKETPAWVSPKHPARKSMFEEARCVSKLGLGSPAAIQRQVDAYTAEGLPEGPLEAGGAGLIEGEWHLRDLGSVDQAIIGCGWLQEFMKRGHKRDQLSFNYVVWKLGLLSQNRARFVDYGIGLTIFEHQESYARKRERKWRKKSAVVCAERRRGRGRLDAALRELSTARHELYAVCTMLLVGIIVLVFWRWYGHVHVPGSPRPWRRGGVWE